MISKTKRNNQKEHQELSEEENYLGDNQYEQERFTDEYSEYFEDDENKADRFTDDYNEDFRLVNIYISMYYWLILISCSIIKLILH